MHPPRQGRCSVPPLATSSANYRRGLKCVNSRMGSGELLDCMPVAHRGWRWTSAPQRALGTLDTTKRSAGERQKYSGSSLVELDSPRPADVQQAQSVPHAGRTRTREASSEHIASRGAFLRATMRYSRASPRHLHVDGRAYFVRGAVGVRWSDAAERSVSAENAGPFRGPKKRPTSTGMPQRTDQGVKQCPMLQLLHRDTFEWEIAP